MFWYLRLCPILLVSVLFASSTMASETRYISDILVINLKSSISPPYSIIEKVKSNDKITILEKSGRYLKIRTANGKEGWIAKQYTTTKLPKLIEIELLQQKNIELENLLQQNPNVTDLTNRIKEKEKRLAAATTALNKATAALAEAQVWKQKYKDLEANIAQQREDDELIDSDRAVHRQITQQRASHSPYENIYWFIAGAIILIIGFLLGKVPGNRNNKRLIY